MGFPGETDADFAATCALVREIGFSNAYTFKYSLRAGTPSAEAADQVEETAKHARLLSLQQLVNAQRLGHAERCVGMKFPILFGEGGAQSWSDYRPDTAVSQREYLRAKRPHRSGPRRADFPGRCQFPVRRVGRTPHSPIERGSKPLSSQERTKARPASATAETPLVVEGSRAVSVATLTFDDNRVLAMVLGHYDQNLAKIERRIGVEAHANGNHLTVKGTPEACAYARRVVERLYLLASGGVSLTLGDVDGAVEECALQGELFESTKAPQRAAFEQVATRKKGQVRARNAAQDVYLRALKRYELVLAEGPAGTGKTWLAVGHAVALLEQGLVERVILSRPAVEAGERLGFLPGDMRDKVDPYLRPIFDALQDFMDARTVERGLQTGMIEVAPLAFMRGRTLSRACVLLDEAQNATAMQMKMFLTRLGEGSRMIVTGDPSQIDLPPGQRSGLSEAISLLSGVEGIGHVVFREGDVVRHDLVRRIVDAYALATKPPSSAASAGR